MFVSTSPPPRWASHRLNEKEQTPRTTARASGSRPEAVGMRAQRRAASSRLGWPVRSCGDSAVDSTAGGRAASPRSHRKVPGDAQRDQQEAQDATARAEEVQPA